MNRIRVAVVGLGPRGRNFWMSQVSRHPDLVLHGVHDPRQPAAARLAAQGDVVNYPTMADVLADDRCDLVIVAARARRQGELAAQVLRAGKHVASEVPAAHSRDDCRAIVAAAAATDRTYFLAEQVRFAGFVQAWYGMARRGLLGAITYAEAQYFHHYPEGRWWYDVESGTFLDATVEPPASAEPTWLQQMPPIHYLPHSLSPLLKVLDDRVVTAVGMSTAVTTDEDHRVSQPHLQAALMQTAKGAIIRVGASFAQRHPSAMTHWFAVHGTGGRVETARAASDSAKLWLADAQLPDLIETGWNWNRIDAPPEARGSGHGDTDHFVIDDLVRSVRGDKLPDLDVHQAMDTALPAICAAESIAQGSTPVVVPDSREFVDTDDRH